MSISPLRALVVALAMVAVVSSAAAQRRGRALGPRSGAHLGYNFDIDELLLGAQFSWPLAPRFDLYPSFDYYFVDPGSLWSLNIDAKLRPPTRYGVLYVGGGLNYSHASFSGNGSSDTGLNLLAGLEGRRTRSAPYVEAKLILAGETSFQLVGGFSVR